MANIDTLLEKTLESDKLTSAERCEEIETIFSLNERYKKRNEAKPLAYKMPTLQLAHKTGKRCQPVDAKEILWMYVTMPCVPVLKRDLAALSKLADHGYPLDQALFLAFHSEAKEESKCLEIVRFLLAYRPEINVTYIETSITEKGDKARKTIRTAAKGRRSEKTLDAYLQLSTATQLFLDLPSIAAKKFKESKESKGAKEAEVKAPAATKKPPSYSDVYNHFLDACVHDGIFVITYLTTRLKNIRTGKELAENNPFLVDFTKQAIRSLGHKAFYVSPTHNHLVNTLLSEWQMQTDYAEILAYYAATCGDKKENIATYVADCLKNIRSKKAPENMTLFLFDFTKHVFNLLDKKAALGLSTYQFLVDLVLKEWDADSLDKSWAFGAAGTTRREFLVSLFSGNEETAKIWKEFLASLADGKLPGANLDKPKDESLPAQSLEVDLPGDRALQLGAPVSAHRRLSLLAAVPVQVVSDTPILAATPSQQCA